MVLGMYATHRQRLLERLRAERAAAVVPTARHKIRNHDCEYRFRPDSDFWYLTGFDEPESVLVLLPGLGGGDDRSVLFLRPRDPKREVWTGRRLGVDAAPERLGVDEAHPIEELWSQLPELLSGFERIVYRSGIDADNDRRMIDTICRPARPGAGATCGRRSSWSTTCPRSTRCASRRAPTSSSACAARPRSRPRPTWPPWRGRRRGVGEREIDAMLEYTFRRRGSTGAAYTNIVAGGANACVLHYVENSDELCDGDLVLIDAGAEWEYYASDVTRTFPVNGSFSADQRALYEVVLAAQLAAIEHARPGNTFLSLHERACDTLVQGLVRIGLLEGPAEKALEDETFKRYFMHRTSHWLGLDVHDCGYYTLDGDSRTLEPGMVLTVEPGVYVAEDDDLADERWRGIGIRIEDDVLITADGHEVLTAAIPKAVEEVEAACAAALASAR